MPQDAWDEIVTSGDATRSLIEKAPKHLYYIGENIDMSLLEGLSVEFVSQQDADAILCTGIAETVRQDLKDYESMLQSFYERDLLFICANPDIIVEYNGKIYWCAGALAQKYENMGGRVQMAGKPHVPIYELACQKGKEILGVIPNKERILAIGDGLHTDIKGANQFQVDSLFIANGVHRSDCLKNGVWDTQKCSEMITNSGYLPTIIMQTLA